MSAPRSIPQHLDQVRQQIREAEARFSRPPNSVRLLAVSKTRSAEEVMAAADHGQACFGESYIQEAVDKIAAIGRDDFEWHFIGRIQSNKTRLIAENFAWVHGLDSIKHARRLSDQRPPGLPPLKLCLQVNVDLEQSKGGVEPEEAAALVAEIGTLPNLSLEGLMTLPAWSEPLEEQRKPFARLRQLRDQLASPALPLATLSMGMSGDLEAAIAEGATIVRIGTAVFGPRNYN
jgi:pyridoxal phosphate enzyme (YggS family)